MTATEVSSQAAVGAMDPNQNNAAGIRASNVITKLDLKTGKESNFYVGELRGLQEPCFVPRKGSVEEGDGYVLCTVSNYESMTSDVVIVDAKRMEIASAKIPYRIGLKNELVAKQIENGFGFTESGMYWAEYIKPKV